MSSSKAVLITGGADRIGRAMALTFAEMGYDVALHYLNSKEKAASTKQDILSMNRRCDLFRADLRDSSAVSSLITEVCNEYDLVSLVNNASVFVESSLLEGDHCLAQEMFDINFKAPSLLTKEFARRQKKGHIINMLDTKVSQNSTRHFDYLLSKKFLYDYTKMTALHLAPHIRVNGIAPGMILPPPGEDEKYLKKRSEEIPLQRPGSLEAIQSTLRYLVQNDFITGEVIYVDGGENLL